MEQQQQQQLQQQQQQFEQQQQLQHQFQQQLQQGVEQRQQQQQQQDPRMAVLTANLLGNQGEEAEEEDQSGDEDGECRKPARKGLQGRFSGIQAQDPIVWKLSVGVDVLRIVPAGESAGERVQRRCPCSAYAWDAQLQQASKTQCDTMAVIIPPHARP